MAKRFYASSLLAAYRREKTTKSYLYSLLVLLIIVVGILYGFFNGGKKSKAEIEMPFNSDLIDLDVSTNLQWLNSQVDKKPVLPQKEEPVSEKKSPSSSELVLDSQRLNAGSMVYEASNATVESELADHVTLFDGSNRLVAGEVLHAVLESAIQSDFAGSVRAILSEPAYSYRGMRVVLPAGTRVIGVYQNNIQAAQVRVAIEWQRLILPNGSSVIFSSPATDPLGRIGVEATGVDTHFWKRFGEASLYSLLSAGAQFSAGSSADTLTAGELFRTQVASSFADTATSDLDKKRNISPTISLDPGSEISIFVRKDIDF